MAFFLGHNCTYLLYTLYSPSKDDKCKAFNPWAQLFD